MPAGLEVPLFQLASKKKGKEVEAGPASLERRNLQRDHDSGLHVSNQGDYGERSRGYRVPEARQAKYSWFPPKNSQNL